MGFRGDTEPEEGAERGWSRRQAGSLGLGKQEVVGPGTLWAEGEVTQFNLRANECVCNIPISKTITLS